MKKTKKFFFAKEDNVNAELLTNEKMNFICGGSEEADYAKIKEPYYKTYTQTTRVVIMKPM
jgi:hypothetical protein